jgi:hypothetical protein
MFNQEYSLTWSELNIVLGFDENCFLDLEYATRWSNSLEFFSCNDQS